VVNPRLLRPGDVLIGFADWGHVNVVSNDAGADGDRDVVIAYQNNRQVLVSIRRLGPDVRVLRPAW
jgi:hypothetical protein